MTQLFADAACSQVCLHAGMQDALLTQAHAMYQTYNVYVAVKGEAWMTGYVRCRHDSWKAEASLPSIWSLSPAGVIMKLSRVTLTDTSGR